MSNQRKIKGGHIVTPQEAQEAEPGGYSGIEPAVAPEDGVEAPEGVQAPPQGKHVVTAFLVLIEDNAVAYASSDINQDLVLARSPSVSDMYQAAAEIMKDIQALETAQRTVALQMEAAGAIQEQARNAKIVARLREKGIHVPEGVPGAHRH